MALNNIIYTKTTYMKNLKIVLFSLLIFSTGFFYSCSDGQTILLQIEKQASLRHNDDTDSDDAVPCISGITVVNGMFKFVDQAHYDETVACLEQAIEAHNDAFDALHQGTQ